MPSYSYRQLDEDNLRQASVIMASFVYHAATRNGLLRESLPEPLEDDPPEADQGQS